jgi:hypothetical protein
MGHIFVMSLFRECNFFKTLSSLGKVKNDFSDISDFSSEFILLKISAHSFLHILCVGPFIPKQKVYTALETRQ